MKPVEELFHIQKDSGEMHNLASNESAQETLKKMRSLYDQQLEHWKTTGVSNNLYPQYVTIFDRSIPYYEKELKRKPHASEKTAEERKAQLKQHKQPAVLP